MKPVNMYKRGNLDVGSFISIFFGIYILLTFMISLIPSLKTLITDSLGNFTAGEQAMLVFIPTLIVFGVIFAAIKGLGFMKK